MSSADQTQQGSLPLSGQKRDRRQSPTPSRSNPDAPPASARGGPPYDPLPNIPHLNPRERESGGAPGTGGGRGRGRHREMQRPPRYPNDRHSTATSRAQRRPQRQPSSGPPAAAGSPSAGGSSEGRSISGLLAGEEQAGQMNLVIEVLDTLADLLHCDVMSDDADHSHSEDNYNPLARQIRRRVEAPFEVVDELERAMRDVNCMVWNNPQLPWTLRRDGPWNEEIREVLDREADPRQRYRIFQGMLMRLRREEQPQAQGRGVDEQRRERIRQLRCVIEDEAMRIDEGNLSERSIADSEALSSDSGGSGSRLRRVPDLGPARGGASQSRSQSHSQQHRGGRPGSGVMGGVGPGADLAQRNAATGSQQHRGGRPGSGVRGGVGTGADLAQRNAATGSQQHRGGRPGNGVRGGVGPGTDLAQRNAATSSQQQQQQHDGAHPSGKSR